MRITSIQFKAAFLLFVFSLSTIVGFACSVGLNTSLTADHHKETAEPLQKGHEHGKSHKHPASDDHQHTPANHHEKQSDPHQEEADHHKKVSEPQENPDDNCCKEEVAKFEKSEKRTPQSFNYNLQPQFVTLVFGTPTNIDVLASNVYLPSNKYFVRNHHPPIADIRLAIQSFLI